MTNVVLAVAGTSVTMLAMMGFSVYQLERMQHRPEFPSAGSEESHDRDPEQRHAA